MGVYCYKITRAKKRKIWDARFRRAGAIISHTVDIHVAEFAYTLGGSMFDVDAKGRTRNERLFDKLCKPTIRAWEKAGGHEGTLYCFDYEDGAEVYAAKSCVWYDTGDNGRVVGHLRSDGKRLRFERSPLVISGGPNWEMRPDTNAERRAAS